MGKASSTVVGILLAPLARRNRLGEAVWTVTVTSVGLVDDLHPRYGLLSNANIGVLNIQALKSQSKAVT